MNDKPETNSGGFSTYAVKLDAGPGASGRHRKVAADVADLKTIEAPTAAMPPADAEREALAELLVEHGCTPSEGLLDKLDGLTTRIAFVRCAEALRFIVRSLEGTAPGRALERALLGPNGQSFADDASEVGTTRQNIAKLEKKTRQRIGRLTAGT